MESHSNKTTINIFKSFVTKMLKNYLARNQTRLTIKFHRKQAKSTLSQCEITNNKDGTVNITGDLIVRFPFCYLPKINFLDGNFECSHNENITSLKNAPRIVTGNFHCLHCKSLESLEGAPEITGSFWCDNCNSLKTLKGAPKTIKGNFHCDKCNNLASLEGAPENVDGEIFCNRCTPPLLEEKNKWKNKHSNHKKRITLENSPSNQDAISWQYCSYYIVSGRKLVIC